MSKAFIGLICSIALIVVTMLVGVLLGSVGKAMILGFLQVLA